MSQADETVDPKKIIGIIEAGKLLARKYREYTGKPLGIAGEVGEFEAAYRLDLQLAAARTPGYDAQDRKGNKYEIKTRVIFDDAKPGQRLPTIKLRSEWQFLVLVILNEELDPQAIYMANREPIREALEEPGSRARNERGQLGLNKFKSLANQVWP
jgi:hypothetical protein